MTQLHHSNALTPLTRVRDDVRDEVKIPSIESIIANRNKLLGRPTEIPLSAFSTQPSRAMPSRYTYIPASELSYKSALADAGATELRRQAGQNQSLTNYYDSTSFYENQKRLFKPLADEEAKTREVTTKTGTQMNQELANITDALGYKKDAAGNKESFLGDLLNLMKGERDARVKNETTVKDENIKPLKLQPVVISRDDVAAYFAHKDISTDPLFDLAIDGDQLGTMLVLKELGLENDIYFMLLPEHSSEYNMIRCVNARDQVNHDQWLSKELIQLLTQNIIMNNPILKVQYMEMINFAIGHELSQLSDSFRKGVNDEFPNADEHMQEEIKIQAAKRISDWANRSIKFREWIAPAYDIDINGARDYTTKADEPRTRKPPDVFSPAKELEREKELKAKSKSQLPVAQTRKKDQQTSSTSKSKDEFMKSGKGVKVIVIAPDAEDRFKRLQVLLGSKQAGNNADSLDEYTCILDSLLKDGKIEKKGYKKYLKIFNQK